MMKNGYKWLILLVCTLAMMSCRHTTPTQVHYHNTESVLTPRECEELTHIFAACNAFDVHVYMVADSISDYLEARKYKIKDELTWWERRNSFIIVYHMPTKWMFVKAPAAYRTIYESRYCSQIYMVQRNAQCHTAKDNLRGLMLIFEQVSHRSIHFSIANSITSVIDWFDEQLIWPSTKFVHLLFFRIPLMTTIGLVLSFRGFTGPIVLLVVLLLLFAIVRSLWPQHAWTFRLLYIFAMLCLICAVFLATPSFDTQMLIASAGMPATAKIIGLIYAANTTTVSSWVAGLFFAILFVILSGLKIWLVYIQYANEADDVRIDKTTNKANDLFGLENVLMIILAFMMPQCLVWAVNAYLFTHIITNFFMPCNPANEKPAASLTEFKIIVYVVAVILSLMFTVWEATLWQSSIVALCGVSIELCMGVTKAVRIILCIVGAILGLGMMGCIQLEYEYFQDNVTKFYLTLLNKENREKVAELLGRIIGWTLLMMITIHALVYFVIYTALVSPAT